MYKVLLVLVIVNFNEKDNTLFLTVEITTTIKFLLIEIC